MTKNRARRRALFASVAVVLALLSLPTIGAGAQEAPTSSTESAPTEVAAPLRWRLVSGGGDTTCGIRTTGRLYCWGYDVLGALGNGGADVDQATPAPVAGAATNWTSVSVGGDHVCALKATHRLYCWGNDGSGAVGDGGADVSRSRPVEVAGHATNWASVSAGGQHTCARKTNGRLYCWGYDASGQLGDGGTDTDRSRPVQVAGGATNWVSVSAGANHTCAIRSTRRLYCWGQGNSRQLGDGMTVNRNVPVEVSGAATDWSSVSAGGQHTCARKTSGRLFCWGFGAWGQLGGGSFDNQLVPTEVEGGATDWAAVNAGNLHTCARKVTGQLWCFGEGSLGQIGDDGDVYRLSPTQVAGAAADWRGIDAGDFHTCGLRVSGLLWCWGFDGRGQLGNAGTNTEEHVPTVVVARPGTADWVLVSTGLAHTCGLRTSGRLYCWGDDAFGQLGDGGTDTDRSRPVQVAGGATNWVSVTTGDYHTCARRSTGRLYCWGRGVSGQLGDGSGDEQPNPVQVSGGASDWVAVDAGGSHTCARKSSGQLFCWGANSAGQVGDNGINADQLLPVEVSGARTDWAAVSVGTAHTCARTTGRHLFCWGSDATEQLGDGAGASDASAPEEVTGAASDWASVSAGALHTCARKTNGRLYCWGFDGDGRLGNGGADTTAPAPVEVSGAATDWTVVTTGVGHACARKANRHLFCWGLNDHGQVGAQILYHPDPGEVTGGFADWTSFDAGGNHACGRRASGRLYCWGDDDEGQLGDGGANLNQYAPAEVA